MAFTTRHVVPVLAALTVGGAFLAHPAAADPDIDGESAAAVVEQLQEQGYTVNVSGVPSGDTALLVTCVVTKIQNPGGPSADPTATSPVTVDVACPLQRG
jgi:hypothetical protein